MPDPFRARRAIPTRTTPVTSTESTPTAPEASLTKEDAAEIADAFKKLPARPARRTPVKKRAARKTAAAKRRETPKDDTAASADSGPGDE